MRITTKLTISMITGEVLEHEFYEYEGELALCDRALQGAATSAAGQAGTVAGGYGAAAGAEEGALSPFYTQEMRAQHLYNPAQINELLTAAESGAGGTTGSLMGAAQREAARTRNASGFTKSLDEVARDRAKAVAGASEGVAAQDVTGAKELQQQGAAGMAGLTGINTAAQLKAMGQQNEDLATAIKAGQSGWLQNMTNVLGTLGSDASAAAKF